MAALGIGIALAGVVIDTDTAARASMIVLGGVLLGALIGWVSEEFLSPRSDVTAGPASTSLLWLLVTAIGVGVVVSALIADADSLARLAAIVVGGTILGSAIGWLWEVRLHSRLGPAAEGAASSAEGQPDQDQHFPKPSFWPLVVVLGVGIAVPGFIADLSSGLQAALVAIGGTIGGIGTIGWYLGDQLSLAPSFASVLASPTGPLRPYAPPIDVTRSEARQILFSKALQDIAGSRFGFPTPEYPDYMTHVNEPHRSIGVQMSDGAVAYPDIVVVQHPENNTEIVAEVETDETVGEATARYEWLPYSHLATLYLYVPVGKGDEAQALCRRFGIPVVGIRTWRYVVGYEGIEINDHYTVPSGPEELLPKILRPG